MFIIVKVESTSQFVPSVYSTEGSQNLSELNTLINEVCGLVLESSTKPQTQKSQSFFLDNSRGGRSKTNVNLFGSQDNSTNFFIGNSNGNSRSKDKDNSRLIQGIAGGILVVAFTGLAGMTYETIVTVNDKLKSFKDHKKTFADMTNAIPSDQKTQANKIFSNVSLILKARKADSVFRIILCGGIVTGAGLVLGGALLASEAAAVVGVTFLVISAAGGAFHFGRKCFSNREKNLLDEIKNNQLYKTSQKVNFSDSTRFND